MRLPPAPHRKQGFLCLEHKHLAFHGLTLFSRLGLWDLPSKNILFIFATPSSSHFGTQRTFVPLSGTPQPEVILATDTCLLVDRDGP